MLFKNLFFLLVIIVFIAVCFPLQQEQFGVGTNSSDHSAWQWEVYSAVGYHQVCLSYSIGKLFTQFYELYQHAIKLNCYQY